MITCVLSFVAGAAIAWPLAVWRTTRAYEIAQCDPSANEIDAGEFVSTRFDEGRGG